MSDRSRMTESGRDQSRPAVARAHAWWYALMAAGGLAFGLFGDRRPFGADVLAHPLVVYYALVAVALVALRIALARPVPDVIPERALVLGCVVGGAAFLVGNWVGVHLIAAH